MKKAVIVAIFSVSLTSIIVNSSCNTVESAIISRTVSPDTSNKSPLSSDKLHSGSWFIQLTDSEYAKYDAKYSVFIVDLFDVKDSFIAEVHKNNGKVIAYFSAGSLEEWRSDINVVSEEAIGAVYDGYPEEKWLDIRHESVKTLVKNRLDFAKKRGFDGVDPDNVDGYSNESNFPLTAEEQLAFNRFIAAEAHARTLLVGLKNDPDQIIDLEPFFDFAVNEQCHTNNECGKYAPFVNAKKHVLNLEYVDEQSQAQALCSKLNSSAEAKIVSTTVATISLDGWFYLCP